MTNTNSCSSILQFCKALNYHSLLTVLGRCCWFPNKEAAQKTSITTNHSTVPQLRGIPVVKVIVMSHTSYDCSFETDVLLCLDEYCHYSEGSVCMSISIYLDRL